MKFTVKRSEWLRGEGKDKSYLLREDGKRCCVGQMCRQLGAPDDELRKKKDVQSVAGSLRDGILKLLQRLLTEDGVTAQWVGFAYERNDNPGITDDLRERQLKKLAAAAGHELEFVD